MLAGAMLKLIEERTGVGELVSPAGTFPGVKYSLARYQGMTAAGLPVPGLHRVEGTLALDALPDPHSLVGATLTLRLEDGRALAVHMSDAGGRILSEGHGPTACGCC